MDKETRQLINDLLDEADGCRNNGVNDLAYLLERAAAKINRLSQLGNAAKLSTPEWWK
jgi:hypothetical protein